MPIQSKSILRKILIWRYKHIPERHFVYILSVLVGFLAGLGTVLLKNFTHYIQLLLKIDLVKNYQSSLYFVFPIIGLFLVYIIKKTWLKKHIGHGKQRYMQFLNSMELFRDITLLRH